MLHQSTARMAQVRSEGVLLEYIHYLSFQRTTALTADSHQQQYGWIWLDMAGYRTLADEAIVEKKRQRAVFTPDGS